MTHELPTATLRQVRALTTGVGFSNVSDRTRIEIAGADRVVLLNGFCTNDIKSLEVGSGCEAFVTNVKGRVLAHVFVFCGQQSLVLDGTPEQAEQIIAQLDRYIIREDVQLHDCSQETGEFLLGGNDSEALLAQLTDREIFESLFSHGSCHIAGVRVHVRRVPIFAGPAFLVTCPGEDTSQISSALAEGGAVKCGADALEVVRVEAGFPCYGRDIHEDNLPQEVNRDVQAISFTKGCYLGQEVVARIDAVGHVNRILCGLRWERAETLPAGASLVVEQQAVGRVTSSIWSPRLEAPLTLAYVRREYARSGVRLETDLGPAEVIELPV